MNKLIFYFSPLFHIFSAMFSPQILLGGPVKISFDSSLSRIMRQASFYKTDNFILFLMMAKYNLRKKEELNIDIYLKNIICKNGKYVW